MSCCAAYWGCPCCRGYPPRRKRASWRDCLREYTDEAIALVLAEAEFGRSYCVKERVDALIQATGIGPLLGRKLGERGAGISGGERQRIALARCLAKENWKFLIIDEPFTSLDALAEDELAGVLRGLHEGKDPASGDAQAESGPLAHRAGGAARGRCHCGGRNARGTEIRQCALRFPLEGFFRAGLMICTNYRGSNMLAIKYVHRNIGRKGWLMYLAGESAFIAKMLISFLIPLAQKELIDTAISGSLELGDMKSITCILLAFGLGIAYAAYISFNGKASGTAFSDMSSRNFERLFAHKVSEIRGKGGSWYSAVVLDETLRQMLNSTYTAAFFSMLQFIFILIIVGTWNSKLVSAILTVCVLYLLFIVFFAKKRQKYEELDKQEYLKLVPIAQEGLEAMRTFLRFGKKDVVFSRMKEQLERRSYYSVKSYIAVGTSSSAEEITFSLIMIAMIFANIDSIRSGTINTGSLVTIVRVHSADTASV